MLELTPHRPILVLGDSHVTVFSHGSFGKAFPWAQFDIVAVPGATVSGLTNPNAKTDAYQKLTSTLNQYQGDTVIVMLGEVDTGFVIWYRAQKYNEDVSKMTELALNNYKQLITEISSRHSPIVLSTPLPTISDERNSGPVANARKEVTVSQRERTALTVHFNREIEHFCLANGIANINLDTKCLSENGIVRNELLNSDPNDHHYNRALHAELLIPPLTRILKQ